MLPSEAQARINHAVRASSVREPSSEICRAPLKILKRETGTRDVSDDMESKQRSQPQRGAPMRRGQPPPSISSQQQKLYREIATCSIFLFPPDASGQAALSQAAALDSATGAY